VRGKPLMNFKARLIGAGDKPANPETADVGSTGALWPTADFPKETGRENNALG